MLRFGSLALAGVAALGCTVAAPNVSRADFDFSINLGRTHFEIGSGRPVVVAAPPVVYSAPRAPVFYAPPPAPVVVDYGCPPIGPRPGVVVPGYTPWPVGYRGYYGPIMPPHHYHHEHHYPRPF